MRWEVKLEQRESEMERIERVIKWDERENAYKDSEMRENRRERRWDEKENEVRWEIKLEKKIRRERKWYER